MTENHVSYDVTLQQLRMIREVSRRGSVTAAAAALSVTQSAVSHALRKVEAELGVELFDRRSGVMAPTPAGERLAGAAGRVAAEISTAMQEVEALRRGCRGILRVTTQGYTSYHWLPEVLRAFGSLHPDVELLVLPELADAPLQAVRERAADIAIVHGFEGKEGLDDRPLGTVDLVLVVGPLHPLAGREWVAGEDLVGETVLSHGAVQLQDLDEFPIRCRRVLEMGPTEVVVAAVRSGMGVTVMPRWVVGPHLASGFLVAARLSREGVTRSLSAVYRSEDAQDGALQDLAHLMACEPGKDAGARP